jgi:16S rRNA C967 or C1407 C5-methylase (RsmB/RsmF family)
MVYSTCTFNPIEDEAVVAELLVRCGGALQLLDVSQHLPELKRLPGKRKWRVRDKFRWYDTWEEAQTVSACCAEVYASCAKQTSGSGTSSRSQDWVVVSGRQIM